jgi:glyoxylase-like metal-dependent hydrolase (beta-lactamase superfamily II)
VDVGLRDGDELPFGGGARVVAAPGHTDGSVAPHLPARRVQFTGDTAASWDGRVIFGVFHPDRAAALTSSRRLTDVDAGLACHGHGDPTTRDAAAWLCAAAERADQVADQG